jgi:hypothetical protein
VRPLGICEKVVFHGTAYLQRLSEGNEERDDRCPNHCFKTFLQWVGADGLGSSANGSREGLCKMTHGV